MGWEFVMLDALQGIRTPFLDAFFKAVTHLGDAGLLWIFLGGMLCCFKKTRRCGFGVLLSLLLGALVTNVMLKPLAARERPCWINEAVQLLIAVPKDYSFPSGHTQAGFAAAMAIFLHDRKYGAAAFLLAALIAFSRLYLYVHFPTDVLGGMVIGLFCGAAGVWMIRQLMRKKRCISGENREQKK